jgi:transketolase
MSIFDSAARRPVRQYSTEELKTQAALMRGYNLAALYCAGSGHTGGTLSVMDITAALYLQVADHDPKNPTWAGRDRIIWSAGHKAPALYVGLAFAGFCEKRDLALLRKLSSQFQGHPHCLKLPGVEISGGSLGQGLSVAVGNALAARLDAKPYSVFCIMGDGEQQEGQIWEAAMEAAHHKLDNLVGIVDKNCLQIDGKVSDVMGIDPIEEKYASFGWEVVRIDGHNMEQVVKALTDAKQSRNGKPKVIIADTVKGKGVSFMENVAGWHGKTPNHDELTKALEELGVSESIDVEALAIYASEYQRGVEHRLASKLPKFSENYWWNAQGNMKVKMEANRKGFGQALAEKAATSASFAWDWISRAPLRSAISTPRILNGSRDGSAWGLPSSRQRRWRQDSQRKAKSLCSAPMQHSRRHETSTRCGSPSATAI